MPITVGAAQLIRTGTQLADMPTGTIVRTGTDYVCVVDHGPSGEWTGGWTHIYPLEPQTGLLFYPANFDLSLPLAAWVPTSDYRLPRR
ncbi:hypothetical protein ACQP1G_42405 [Nocardia sp. CA-107356]|uniref:hypothetical protein n=1 Tax=Nocardia sp. CA-107356 TaxID=3239972 RepID=UPI003D8C3710